MASEKVLIPCLVIIAIARSIMTDSKGRNFIFSFPDYGYQDQFTLVVTSQQQGEITIKIPYLNSISTSNLRSGSTMFNISSTLASDKLAVRRKAIHVTSTVDITLHGLQIQYVSDYSFLIFPSDIMSKSYIATSFISGSGDSESQSYVTVTAVNDNTHVNLTIPLKRNATVLTKSTKRQDSRELVTAELNQYEVLNFASNGDLTGTLVESDKPVSVTSGSSDVIIPNMDNPNFDWRDQNVISSVLPTNLWQKRYIVMPFMNQEGYVVRITASKENTNLDITSESKVKISTAGDFHDVIVNTSVPIYVIGDQPISVQQFTKSTNFRKRSDKDGGNVMITVPSIEQYGNGTYYFTVPQWSPDTRDKIYNYIGISVPTANIACLLLDGKYPYMHADIQTLTVQGVNYNIITTDINPGYHNLFCNDSSVSFGVMVYGFSAANGYGYPVYLKY